MFGTCAITAVTAQNTAEVRAVHVLPADVVRQQIEAVLDDFDVAAVKTGMLATSEIVELVAEFADAGRLPNLVVDPVMVSSSGAQLLDEAAERSYLERLLQDGLLTMDPPAGRRGRGLHLTPKGETVIQQGFPVWREAQTRTIRVLGPESRSLLDGLLTQAEKLAAA